MRWFINVFRRCAQCASVISCFVWLDFRFVKAKIGRNSFAWERNGNKSVINEKFMVNLWKFMFLKTRIIRNYTRIYRNCNLLIT